MRFLGSAQPAYALVRVEAYGTVTLAELSDEGMRRSEVLASARRTSSVTGAELQTRWGDKDREGPSTSRHAVNAMRQE